MDYAGATVKLLVSKDKGTSWSTGSYTTTSDATHGDNYTLQYGFPLPAEYSWIFKIEVAIPAGFEATKTGGASDLTVQRGFR